MGMDSGCSFSIFRVRRFGLVLLPRLTVFRSLLRLNSGLRELRVDVHPGSRVLQLSSSRLADELCRLSCRPIGGSVPSFRAATWPLPIVFSLCALRQDDLS
jgi:hypothetical protein